MIEKVKHCEACNDPFYMSDIIIEVNNEFYHRDCVEIYPTGYYAMLDGEPLGETENDDGTEAWDLFDEGKYLEDLEDEE